MTAAVGQRYVPPPHAVELRLDEARDLPHTPPIYRFSPVIDDNMIHNREAVERSAVHRLGLDKVRLGMFPPSLGANSRIAGETSFGAAINGRPSGALA